MTSSQPASRTFSSDNYSGVHPQIIEAITEANVGHASSYGSDPWTARFGDLCRQIFGQDALAYPVFNGTGANVISLQSVLPRWGAVVCAQTAHIHCDEGGAPEKVGGLKLLPVETEDGKLTPELVATEAWGFGDEHRAQPLAISISQTTELGTFYTPGEVCALADFAHERGMALHVDGARLSNAAAHLLSLKTRESRDSARGGLVGEAVDLRSALAEITTDAGVDVLSFGGTKNGLMGAEAVVVLNPDRCEGLKYLRKTDMQLGSKMRFISAQLLGLYEGDLWLRSARHSNGMATRLRERLEGAVPLPYPTESNVVFARLSDGQKERARARFHFYDWPAAPGLVRLMCSWDTTEEDVEELAALITG